MIIVSRDAANQALETADPWKCRDLLICALASTPGKSEIEELKARVKALEEVTRLRDRPNQHYHYYSQPYQNPTWADAIRFEST